MVTKPCAYSIHQREERDMLHSTTEVQYRQGKRMHHVTATCVSPSLWTTPVVSKITNKPCRKIPRNYRCGRMPPSVRPKEPSSGHPIGKPLRSRACEWVVLYHQIVIRGSQYVDLSQTPWSFAGERRDVSFGP